MKCPYCGGTWRFTSQPVYANTIKDADRIGLYEALYECLECGGRFVYDCESMLYARIPRNTAYNELRRAENYE